MHVRADLVSASGIAIGLIFSIVSCTHDVVLADLTTESTCGNGIVESGEACDVASAGCVACEVAPDWTCDRNVCQTICGDGVVSDVAACGSPKRDTACDMTGFWGVRETDFERDTVLASLQTSSNWYFYHVTQSGDAFVIDQFLDCGVHVSGSATVDYTPDALRGIIYQNRMDDFAGPHGARHGTSIASGTGCAITLERWYAVRGAETTYLPGDFSLDPPSSSLPPLPTESDPVNGTDSPPGLTDPDGDGIPGVAFLVTGFVTGTRNSAQRTWKEYATTSDAPVAAGALTFAVPGAFDVQENVIRVTDCGGSCSLLASAAHAAQGVPGRITFAFVGKTFGSPRVAAVAADVPRRDLENDLTTCANVRLLLPHDATAPTP